MSYVGLTRLEKQRRDDTVGRIFARGIMASYWRNGPYCTPRVSYVGLMLHEIKAPTQVLYVLPSFRPLHVPIYLWGFTQEASDGTASHFSLQQRLGYLFQLWGDNDQPLDRLFQISQLPSYSVQKRIIPVVCPAGNIGGARCRI